MNRALHMGIVLAVVAHMLCGCCLHHAHLYNRQCQATDSDVRASCDHGQPGEAGGGRPDGDRFPDGQSEGRRCVFTRPDSPGVADLLAGPEYYVPATALADPRGARVADALDARFRHRPSSIRLHLLNQALLL